MSPRTRIQWAWPAGSWMVVRWHRGQEQVVARFATSRPPNPDCQPVLCPELGSLQRYRALPDGAREVAEDEHIAGSDYPHPAPIVCRSRRVQLFADVVQSSITITDAMTRMRDRIDQLVARAMAQGGRITTVYDD